MPKSTERTAYATGTCSDCGHEYHVKVPLIDGPNEYDVKCGACGHYNLTREVTGA